MSTKQYCLSSKAYKSTVFTGFSRLQKEDEFVDLTLAADGSFCKVHKSLIALASPYLRDILRNLRGDSPVIFLNKVTKEILGYIIEYIYQGDVTLPISLVDEFIEVCNSLHIAGFADLAQVKVVSAEPLESCAKKRKLGEDRYIEFVVEKSTNCNNLNLCENANIDYDDNYCMEDQNKTLNANTNNCLAQSIHAEPYQESKSQLTVKNGVAKFDDIYCTSSEHQNPSTQIENQKPLEMPTENTINLLRPGQVKDYKIIVKPAKEQTDATDNIPVIEIQHIGMPIQPECKNSAMVDILNLLSMQAEPQSFHTNQMQIQTVTDPDQKKAEKADPIINILSNEAIKSAEIEFSTQAFQANQLQIQTVIDQDQKNAEKSVPFISTLSNDNSAETEFGVSSITANLDDMKHMAQYSLSERGALQLILNRFIYCRHGTSIKKQRWRCIDYRKLSCPAMLDTTADGVILQRKGTHVHKFHDKKIMKKHKENLIFSTVGFALLAIESKMKEDLKIKTIEQIDDDN